MVMSTILLRTNASRNLLARRFSRERTLDRSSVVGMILMFTEIKSTVFRMKFISHQRQRLMAKFLFIERDHYVLLLLVNVDMCVV